MNNSINQHIQELKYDPAIILAFEGETYGNVYPLEDQMENDKYIVIKNEKQQVNQPNYDIAIVAAMNDRTYPGALLLANQNLVNNMPSGLYAKRAPIKLRINLPGMEEQGTKTVDNPSFSAISEAINNMTAFWFKNYAATYHIPTNCSYSESKVYNADHMRAMVGFDLAAKLDLDFKAVRENKKQIFVLTFKQIFYTVSVDAPEQPGAFFADDEKWENLTANGVSNEAPPVYVANVSYGRSIYVTMQTTNMSSEIEAKLKTAISGNQLNGEVFKDSVFENSEYSVVVLGGDAEKHTTLITKDFGEIEKIITENSLFSEKNQGAPISYTAVFLKENAIAVINSAAEYILTTYTEYTKGSIKLDHTGGYIAKFCINWKERRYRNGEEQLTDHGWEKNGSSLTAPFSTVIPLPANAVKIHVKATEKTGLVWEPWRTIVDEDVPLAPEVKISVWGTTLNQKGKVEVIN